MRIKHQEYHSSHSTAWREMNPELNVHTLIPVPHATSSTKVRCESNLSPAGLMPLWEHEIKQHSDVPNLMWLQIRHAYRDTKMDKQQANVLFPLLISKEQPAMHKLQDISLFYTLLQITLEYPSSSGMEDFKDRNEIARSRSDRLFTHFSGRALPLQEQVFPNQKSRQRILNGVDRNHSTV